MAGEGVDVAVSEDGEPEAEPSPVRRGRMLGRYVLCYELASGGMATVYLARADGPAGFGKLVALKLIHPHLAKQKDFVEMFLDEARIAARIVHPNVCSVFDFGQEGDTYFLAMDYLVGETLARVTRAVWRRPEVAARPSTARIFARIVADACEGLHAAHESRGDDGALLGVVHRDVTPQNLFAGYDGSIRVVDFGVAMSVGRSHQTTAGTLKGKYPYMSPEQIAQQPVDRRSDVWSLGVCLWEMLTGRRLFRRDGEFETLKAVTADLIPAPSAVRPGVPQALDAIVAKALARDREQRYATAREMGRDLAAAIGALGGAGAADVAELMDELFQAERAERSALIERARRVDPEQPSTSKVAPVPGHAGPYGGAEASASGVQPGAGSRRAVYVGGTLAALLGASILAALTIASSSGETERSRSSAAAAAPATTGTPATTGAPATTVAATASAPPIASTATTAEIPPSEAPPPLVPAPATTTAAPHEHTAHRAPHETLAAAPSGAPGTVNVVTPPGWAEIFVRGARVGRSPTSITLPAGTTTVRLVPYGTGAPIERSVTVEAGATTRLVVRLEAPAP